MNSGWSWRHLGRITCGLILLCLGWPACPVAPSSVAAPPIQGQMQVGDQPPLRLAPDQAAPTTLHLNAAPPPLTFSLQTEAHMAYRYRLTGWDARWHPLPAGSSVIRYAALPPGHYRFQLQSALTGAASPLAQCDIWVAAGHWRSATWIPPLALLAILLLWAGYRWPRRASGLQHPVHSPPPQSPLACQGALASELRESLQLLTPPLATLQAVGDPAVWPVANQVARGVSRLQGLLGQLIQLSQSTDPVWSERQTLILRSWLSPRLEQYRQQAQAHQVDWQTAMPPDIAVTLDGPRLDHLLRVLLAQTLALAGPGGAIHLAICLDESQNQLVLRLQGRAPVSRVSPTKAADGERLEIRLLQQQVQQQGGQLNELDQALGETGWQVRLPCLWTRLNWLAPHQTPLAPPLAAAEAPVLLLIEDDPDLQQLLLGWLSGEYRLLLSSSIQGGLSWAREALPDLILCDQRLPDGECYWLLDDLKSSAETSHIPIIICSVLDDEASRRRAWHQTADDYIQKPFEPGLLRLRLRALLQNRQRLRQWLQTSLSPPMPAMAPAGGSGLPPTELLFGEQLRTISCQLLREERMSVEAVAEHFKMSSRSLQRKLNALFGLTYSDYVRELQLQLVVEQLQLGASVKEAAALAGFRDQAYLTRVFKQQFGITPSQYKKQTPQVAASAVET